MSADRHPVRSGPAEATLNDVTLRTADPGRDPDVWRVYQRGLHEAYSRIGAGDLAMGPEPPAGVTAVVVATSPHEEEVIGGVLLRERAEIPELTEHPQVAAAIAERLPQGVNELGGCWVHPAWRRTGLGTALAREGLRAAAGGGRWTVTLANQHSLGVSLRVKFVPDERFRNLPFPNDLFDSTLCWFDHDGEIR